MVVLGKLGKLYIGLRVSGKLGTVYCEEHSVIGVLVGCLVEHSGT